MRLHDPRPVMPDVGRWLLTPMLAAGLLGFLVGGVGGRLAMLVLRLTSDAEVVGLESDDGFTIGRVSGDTIFLVGFATVGSAVLFGPLYAVARHWVPQRARSLSFGVLLGLVGGAVIVHVDGVDFTVISPRSLAIALFVALPAAFGAMLEPVHQWLQPHVARVPRKALMVFAVPVTLSPLLFGPFIALAVIGWGMVVTGQHERLVRLVLHPVTTWAGRAAFGALASIAALDLARDVNALLL